MTTMTATYEEDLFPWWLILIEGVALLIIGLLLITAPGTTLSVLVQILGIYWLVKGIFNIVSIFINSAMWGWKLFAGIIGVLAGLAVIRHPLYATILVPSVYAILLGITALIAGVINLFQAFKGAGWATGLLGGLNILFGALLLANPILGAATLVLILAVLALIGGIAAIIGAFQLR